ncbi:S1/P1 nuclease [Robertkochia solimangrovi]|uniref:S1/P1 nuclease n=1 Tax=Robertkochia solimangrovi TaxID=2213046 RepID=UPI00117DFCD2|nr:S1/P1 nuclease [Robertkochia solimangrovi]TRZ41782.1 S1/P1 Nuclease [Robertkochia solimangrovi]
MRIFTFILLFTVVNAFANSDDWGKTGHRTTAEVAARYLDRSAQREVERILGGASLALVSNFGDDIKSDPEMRKYSPWHYVNMDAGSNYGDVPPVKEGDIVQAIEKCISVLKDKNATDKDKAFYLKLLVHFMGDLHQPLHVGRAGDKGGNDIQVRWFSDGSNLHRVWDSEMIDFYGMSYTELSNNLPVIGKEETKRIAQGSLLDWVAESQQIADKVYDSASSGDKLGYAYMYDYFDVVRSQLLKGGIRLAEVLNDIF